MCMGRSCKFKALLDRYVMGISSLVSMSKNLSVCKHSLLRDNMVLVAIVLL